MALGRLDRQNGISESNWKQALERVLSKMFVNEEGCWIFTGFVDPITGYGQVKIGNKNYKVHRFIAFCFHGLDINNKKIDSCHSCDVRNCINPFHLWLGTRSQNLSDSSNKGRWHRGGGRNPNFINGLKEKDWGIFKKSSPESIG